MLDPELITARGRMKIIPEHSFRSSGDCGMIHVAVSSEIEVIIVVCARIM